MLWCIWIEFVTFNEYDTQWAIFIRQNYRELFIIFFLFFRISTTKIGNGKGVFNKTIEKKKGLIRFRKIFKKIIKNISYYLLTTILLYGFALGLRHRVTTIHITLIHITNAIIATKSQRAHHARRYADNWKIVFIYSWH